MSKSTQISKACDFIKSKIRINNYQKGDRLPTTNQIALELEIDTHVIAGALKVLQESGHISIFHRKGIFVGAIDSPPSGKRPAKPKIASRSCVWRQIRSRLESDIFSNTFAGMKIPSLSALALRYKVCYPTIRKACEALMCDGVLSRNKNQYEIASVKKSSAHSTILSISNANSQQISLYNAFITNGITELELACSKHDIMLEKKGSDSDNDGKSIKMHIEKTDGYFGYVIWSLGVGTILLNQYVELLSRFNKPVAIIDECYEYVLPDFLVSRPLVKIFTPAGSAAGKKIGRHLLERGHRHCAYISCVHKQIWSQQRLQGVVDTFAQTGIAARVTPLVWDTDTPTDVRAIKDQRAFAHLVAEEFKKNFPTAQSWGLQLMESFLAGIEKWEFFGDTILRKNLFCTALSDTTITAWICANDITAVIAKSFLKEIFPDQSASHIAIVGFDDTPVASEHNLTSYNFTPSAVIEKVFGYILYPKQELYLAKTIIECEGLLTERDSTSQKLL